MLAALRDCDQDYTGQEIATLCSDCSKMYFHMRKSRTQFVTSLAILLAWCACASALDPSLDISQYAHTSWKVRDGFTKGSITAIAQTPDGYLWLGTEFGLLRFDGFRAVPWQPPSGQQLPSIYVEGLLVARDGTLWIGTLKGLASWKSGKLTTHPEFEGESVPYLVEGREGTVWVGGIANPSHARLCAIEVGSIHCHGEDGSLDPGVYGLYEDSKGSLWVGVANGIWRWEPGPPEFFSMPKEGGGTSRAFGEDDDGTLLIGTGAGVQRFVNGHIAAYPLSSAFARSRPVRMLRDRDGGMWIATLNRGLVHVRQGEADGFSQADGLSNDFVESIIEDREGTIWVATLYGLDRFRAYTVPTISAKQGLSGALALSVLATNNGEIWIATPTGLNRLANGHVSLFNGGIQAVHLRPKSSGLTPHSIYQDAVGRIWLFAKTGFGYLKKERFAPIGQLPNGQVHDIAELASGQLWLAHDDGLFHVVDGKVVENIPWAVLGHRDFAFVIAADPSKKGFWLGFFQGGLAYFADGKIRDSYSVANGLGAGQVNHLRFGARGALWAATQGGLSRIDDAHIAALTSKNGLPCDAVHWTIEDDEHAMWLYMPCGLVRVARSELDAWVREPHRTVKTTVLDTSDGVWSHSVAVGYSPHVTKSLDGRIWFANSDGVSVIDPHNLHENKLPPPVHIEKITADEKAVDVSNGMHLPTGVRHLDIDYTALSLVVAEKVHFRVKLEGEDKDWRELVNVRHVEYTNLPPKHYRFRVLACNNSGVWNEEGAALDFVIPPAWYQTNWFRGACIAAFLMMIWGIHELRVRQLAAQFNMRLEERVAERTRIARDLHDTLLQSFQGLLLQFKAISYRMQPGEIKKSLDAAIGEASQAITEGRDTVQGLRASTLEKNDLALAIRSVGEELAAAEMKEAPPTFQVFVEGTPRSLHPILRDEVYRVAAEALRNAFRHSQAHRIEVELRYDEKDFKVRIRDDGRGIDREVLASDGRKGHFGLHGMRERAKLAGGDLAIWSEQDSGTEIELTIPASRAYTKAARRFRWFRNRSEKDTQEKVES